MGGTYDLDGAFSVVNTDSAIKCATLQNGTLAVASGQMLTLYGVTLDNVTLSGGSDNLGSAPSVGERTAPSTVPLSRTARLA